MFFLRAKSRCRRLRLRSDGTVRLPGELSCLSQKRLDCQGRPISDIESSNQLSFREADAFIHGTWLGVVAAPEAVLIRPDGYVGWVGDRSRPGLADVLTTWFGPGAAGRQAGMTIL